MRLGHPGLGRLDAPEAPGGVAAGDTRPVHGGAQLGRSRGSATYRRVGLGLSPRPEGKQRQCESQAPDLSSKIEQVSFSPVSVFQGMLGKQLRLVKLMKKKAFFSKSYD